MRYPEFRSLAVGVVIPVTVRPETPGLLPVKEPGEKPLATTTCDATADLTSTLLKAEAGSLHTTAWRAGDIQCKSCRLLTVHVLEGCACAD